MVVVGGGVGDAVEVVDEEVASAVVSDGSPVPDPDPDNQRIDARLFFSDSLLFVAGKKEGLRRNFFESASFSS